MLGACVEGVLGHWRGANGIDSGEYERRRIESEEHPASSRICVVLKKIVEHMSFPGRRELLSPRVALQHHHALPTMGDFMGMTSSDDDLDIVKAVKKDLGHEDYIDSTYCVAPPPLPRHLIRFPEVISTQIESDSQSSEEHDPKSRKRKQDACPEGEKIDFSDEDSEEAYKNFKNRKSVKRKKAAASTRKAKAVEKENVVGKRQKKLDTAVKGKGKEKQWGDESNDDQLMEYTLPDYLKNRRARFDKRTEKLQAAGLKLPPKYDDIDFSDDERLQDLAERPDFPKGKPAALYKDKQLPKSLGLIPAPIAQWLRDYQVEGTAFLHALFVYQTGGILGDDMGVILRTPGLLIHMLTHPRFGEDSAGHCILDCGVWEDGRRAR